MSPPFRPYFGLLVFAVAALGLLGCGGQPAPKSAAPPGGEARVHGEPEPGRAEAKQDNPANAPPPGTPPAERKIIYTAYLDLVVKDLKDAWEAAEKVVAENKGYVAKSEVRSDTGSRRTGTYTLRVPVDRFPGVLARLKELGTPERDATDSQDVTEEFVDVQARVKNLKERENKLTELLKEKRKEEKVEDIIKISDRIDDVRRDIDRAEGRLKYLSTLSALSTVNLTLKEIKDYKPPTAPTFGQRVGRTFGGSWEALVDFLEGLVLTAVALTPWLPVLIPAGLLLFFSVRRLRRWPAPRPELTRRPRPPEEPGPAPG